MTSPIALAPLPRTSPTIWSQMRQCGLRGALSATPDAQRWVLHDPRIWLGTAFHRVMEAAGRAIGMSAEAVWSVAVTDLATDAANHPLDRRYGPPDRWPGYFLVRQRALASAAQVAAKGLQSVSRRTSAKERRAESLLRAKEGRLVGKPDRFDRRIITEYKSSLPDPDWPGAQELLDSFTRQIRLYAVLIAETTGHWPAKGRIVAASGRVLEISLVRDECEAEATNALTALDAVNAAIRSEVAPEVIAMPSAAACGQCPYHALCPAFWRRLKVGPLELPRVAVQGELRTIELGQDGDLYSVHLANAFASHAILPQQEIVLRRSTHGDLAVSRLGANVRITSAWMKLDGRLRADISTLAFDVGTLPLIASSVRD